MVPRDDEEEDTRTYTAVVNHEEQYSIWFADKEIPAGWRSIGKTGPKKECLALIGQIWTDMRPLSLRKWMEEQAKNPPPPEPPPPAEPPRRSPINDLVERLSVSQDVHVDYSSEDKIKWFQEAVGRRYVHVTFTKTGTTLGIPMEQDEAALKDADFANRKGKLPVTGKLVLNYNKVRFHGEIDLSSGKGSGRLEFLGEFKPGEDRAAESPTR